MTARGPQNEIILGVPVGATMAGVVRHRSGGLMFPGPVDGVGGVILTDFRAHTATVEGQTVAAGRLPDAAVSVEVIDDAGKEHEATVGDGVWVAVAGEAGFAEPLVRFRDDARAIVASPLPAGPRRPVAGAREPCPVCGEVAWVEIATEYDVDEVRCERCGQEVGAGMFFFGYEEEEAETEADAEPDDEDEDEEGPDDVDPDDAWPPNDDRNDVVLASVTFPSTPTLPVRRRSPAGRGARGTPTRSTSHTPPPSSASPPRASVPPDARCATGCDSNSPTCCKPRRKRPWRPPRPR